MRTRLWHTNSGFIFVFILASVSFAACMLHSLPKKQGVNMPNFSLGFVRVRTRSRYVNSGLGFVVSVSISFRLYGNSSSHLQKKEGIKAPELNWDL